MSNTRDSVVLIASACAAIVMSSWWLYKRRKSSHVPTVTIVGDIFCDVIATNVENLPSVWGTDTVVRAPITVHSGGSGLNTSVWLSRLCASDPVSDVLVKIARNFQTSDKGGFESIVEDTLHEAGIEIVDPIAPSDFPVGTCICLSGESDRSFVTYRGGNSNFGFNNFKLDELIYLNQQHLHIAGYYNCPGLWAENAEAFINLCRSKCPQMTISLNPQYGEGWGGNIQKLLPLVDFFICNSVEAQGIASGGSGQILDVVESAVKLVKQYACPCAIITLGADGALVARSGTYQGEGTAESEELGCTIQRALCKELLESPILDTVGVGDAFCGGFLSQVVKHRLKPSSPGLIDAVRFGCACGTAALTVIGGSTFPGIETVRASQID